MLRRLFVLAPQVASAVLLATLSAYADSATTRNKTVSPDGIERTILESHIDAAGNEFRLMMVTYPPGVGLPAHHHPSTALNYVLDGAAESQYAGKDFHVFKAGDTFQDEPDREHTIFRNASQDKPLTYLITFTVKAGESFLLIP